MTDARSNKQVVHSKHIVIALISITCTKVLLIPSYYSTDFDVHRNWLALTKHLPLKDWYFDDQNERTVHTLDYPPTFAYFEYLLSNNFVTRWLMESSSNDDGSNNDDGRLKIQQCLEQRPDTDNTPSKACIVFHRSTVILSDVVLWLGAFIACHDNNQLFLLIVLNPALLWLDHVHFQYNGMLLGLLMASLGLLIRGQQMLIHHQRGSISYHAHHLGAAFLYALLVTMKHLYLTLAPVYLMYLMRQYCFTTTTTTTTSTDQKQLSFQLSHFVSVALVTGTTMVAPFVPFLMQEDPWSQMNQIASRLFPFGRGLVHDYWAANIWALYMLMNKIVVKLCDVTLEEFVTPTICALCLLMGLLPAFTCAWRATSKGLIYCFCFTAMSSFMLAYHVHEKAILTALVPLTLLAHDEPKLFLRITALGLVGLFPLLFRPVELLFKLISFICYMMYAYITLGKPKFSRLDWIGCGALTGVVVLLEILHPLLIAPRMEFLPLLLTSCTCAVGLIACWIQLGVLMWRQPKSTTY